jgi:uncharacterized protein YfdQ (DUF2303 family)
MTDDLELPRNNVDATRDLMETYGLPHKLDLQEEGCDALLVPNGYEIRDMEPYLEKFRSSPRRRKGIANLDTVESFIGHVMRFKDDHTAIFASKTDTRFLAVLDYHEKRAEGKPRFGEHRTFYAPRKSREWDVWVGKNRQGMSQSDFAEFLEDNLGDILSSEDGIPENIEILATQFGTDFASPSRLLELSRGMKVHSNDTVKQAVNLATGEVTVQYVTEHHDGGNKPLKVPGLFMIAVPVYEGGQLYQIAVRLRYRVKEGRITWFYELYRHDKVLDDAFEGVCGLVEGETSLPVFRGSPE